MRLTVSTPAPSERLPADPTAGGLHVPALDGIRGLAIALVMVYHFAAGSGVPRTALDGWFRNAATVGWVGVDLFFVLSGFLITGILFDNKGTRHFFRDFWGRRTLRIFPLYYAFLVGWLIILPRVFAGQLPSIPEGSEVWSWTYATNVLLAIKRDFWAVPPGTGHFWSLAVEEQFYLIWPFAVYAMGRRRMMQFCVVCIVLAAVSRAVVVGTSDNQMAAYVLMPMRMDALAIGGLVALLMRDEPGRRWLATWTRPLLIASLGVVGVLIWMSPDPENALSAFDGRVQVFGFLPIAIVAGGLIVMSLDPARASSRFQRWLRSDIARLFGRYSYGLYVFHVPIAKTVKTLLIPDEALPGTFGTELPSQFALIALLAAISLAVAAASYHGFEVHFLRLKRFFQSSRRDARVRES